MFARIVAWLKSWLPQRLQDAPNQRRAFLSGMAAAPFVGPEVARQVASNIGGLKGYAGILHAGAAKGYGKPMTSKDMVHDVTPADVKYSPEWLVSREASVRKQYEAHLRDLDAPHVPISIERYLFATTSVDYAHFKSFSDATKIRLAREKLKRDKAERLKRELDIAMLGLTVPDFLQSATIDSASRDKIRDDFSIDKANDERWGMPTDLRFAKSFSETYKARVWRNILVERRLAEIDKDESYIGAKIRKQSFKSIIWKHLLNDQDDSNEEWVAK